MALTADQQRALTLAEARRRRAEQEGKTKESPAGGGMQNVRNFAGGFNKRLVDTIGGAADIVNTPFRAMGVPGMGQAGDTRRKLAGAAESVGIDIPDKAQGAAGSMGEVGAEAMMAFAPMAKGVQALSKARGTAGRVGQSMLDNFLSPSLRKQGSNLAVEAGGVAGAGLGRDAAQNSSPTGQMYAEMAGGVLGSMAPGAATGSVLRGGGRAIYNRLTRPWTEAGAIESASKIAQDWALDPSRAAQAILDTKGTNLRPSAVSADPGLMALEATVLHDPSMVGLASNMQEEAQYAMYQLVDSIKKSGSAKTTRSFLEAKVDRLGKALDASKEIAAERAAQKLAAVEPSAPAADISAAVKGELETALADAKVQEAMLWQAIPEDAPTPNKALKRAYRTALDSLSAAQSDDMPSVATKVIASMDLDEVPLMEVDGLYKKLGEIQRQAKAAGDWNKARIAGDLRAAALDDMGNAKGPDDVKHSIKLARAYSRKLNETFNRGAAGKILGYASDGGDRIDATLGLRKTVGMRGQQGKLAADELGRAKMVSAGRADEAMTFTDSAQGFVSENLGAMKGVQEFIKSDFMRNAVEDGVVNPTKAATFLKQNAEVLEAFPHLREQLSAASHAVDVVRNISKRNDAWKKAMDKPSVSAAAKFLRAPVDKEVERVMSSDDPASTVRQLMRSVGKNAEAKDGLRAGLSEWLIKQGTRNEQLDSMGRLPVNGPALSLKMKDPRVRSAFEAAFSADELKQFDRNIDLLSRLTLQRGARPGQQIQSPSAPWVIQKLARMVGARFGAKLAGTTGGSIQMAQMGATEAEKMTNRLVGNPVQAILVDALFGDGELMTALLKKDLTKQGFSLRDMTAEGAANQIKDKTIRSYYYSRWAPLLKEED